MDMYKRNQYTDIIKRNCPECKITVADANVCKEIRCAQCGTNLDFQCARCEQKFSTYSSLNWHQHSCSTVINYNCKLCSYNTKDKVLLRYHMANKHGVVDESTATSSREKHSDLINRICPTCKITVADAKKAIEQTCTQCGTKLIYQCARCNKESKIYNSMIAHIKSKCNAQKLDWKCEICAFSTDTEYAMKAHMRACVSGIQFGCGLCKYSSKVESRLRAHMTTVHKDVLKMDCSQHNAEPNKCEQCKKKVTICETCYTGFSSTDGFQEHLKSCEPQVLECKYCSYKTNVNKNFKAHMSREHLSAPTSQN